MLNTTCLLKFQPIRLLKLRKRKNLFTPPEKPESKWVDKQSTKRNATRKKSKPCFMQQRPNTPNRGTLRPYILLTLSHAEKRTQITKKDIIERINRVLLCNAIVVAKEEHEEGGFHYHVGMPECIKEHCCTYTSAVLSRV